MCCGSLPRVQLVKRAAYRPIPQWHDRCASSTPVRVIQWLFYRNGQFVFSTPYAVPSASLAIGTGSTYSLLNATEVQITSFLIGQGISISTGDLIQMRVRIRNCDKEFALSNPLGFNAPVIAPLCDCDFVIAYDSGQTGRSPVPPVGFIGVGGQLLLVNGLLTDGTVSEAILPTDELMWATLSGGCGDEFEIATIAGQTGNVTVPAGFLAAVPDPSVWIVARNGVVQSDIIFSSGSIVPNIPSDPNDIWVFAGLTAGDCSLLTIPVAAGHSGASVNLPSGYSSANLAKFFPVRNGVVMYEAGSSISGYSIAGSVITPETPFENEEIWLIAIG